MLTTRQITSELNKRMPQYCGLSLEEVINLFKPGEVDKSSISLAFSKMDKFEIVFRLNHPDGNFCADFKSLSEIIAGYDFVNTSQIVPIYRRNDAKRK